MPSPTKNVPGIHRIPGTLFAGNRLLIGSRLHGAGRGHKTAPEALCLVLFSPIGTRESPLHAPSMGLPHVQRALGRPHQRLHGRIFLHNFGKFYNDYATSISQFFQSLLKYIISINNRTDGQDIVALSNAFLSALPAGSIPSIAGFPPSPSRARTAFWPTTMSEKRTDSHPLTELYVQEHENV